MWVLVVCAHPDDESLGCGETLAKNPGSHVIMLTDAYRYAGADRKDEKREMAQKACELAGATIEFLGLEMRSVAYRKLKIAERIVEIVRANKPDVIFTHALEGGHPDHDAAHVISAWVARSYDIEMLSFYMQSSTGCAPTPKIRTSKPADKAALKIKRQMIEVYRAGIDGSFIPQTLNAYCDGKTSAIPDIITDKVMPPFPNKFFADYHTTDEIERVKELYGSRLQQRQGSSNSRRV